MDTFFYYDTYHHLPTSILTHLELEAGNSAPLSLSLFLSPALFPVSHSLFLTNHSSQLIHLTPAHQLQLTAAHISHLTLKKTFLPGTGTHGVGVGVGWGWTVRDGWSLQEQGMEVEGDRRGTGTGRQELQARQALGDSAGRQASFPHCPSLQAPFPSPLPFSLPASHCTHLHTAPLPATPTTCLLPPPHPPLPCLPLPHPQTFSRRGSGGRAGSHALGDATGTGHAHHPPYTHSLLYNGRFSFCFCFVFPTMPSMPPYLLYLTN